MVEYTFKKIHWFNFGKYSKFSSKKNNGYLYGVLVYDKNNKVVNNIWYKTIKERKEKVVEFRESLKNYNKNVKKE